MTIQNPTAYLAGVWDWSILNSCFGDTRISPTDVDGLAERKGKFLLIEAKQSGVELPMGQKITFEALRKTGLFTIVIVWGEQNKPEAIQILRPENSTSRYAADLKEFRRVVSGWFQYANK